MCQEKFSQLLESYLARWATVTSNEGPEIPLATRARYEKELLEIAAKMDAFFERLPGADSSRT